MHYINTSGKKGRNDDQNSVRCVLEFSTDNMVVWDLTLKQIYYLYYPTCRLDRRVTGFDKH